MKAKSCCMFLGSVFLVFIWCALAEAAWYADCPSCARHLGGSGRAGPYPSKQVCQAYVNKMKAQSFPFGSCYGSDDSGGGSSYGGGLSPGQQMELQMMEQVIGSVFAPLFQSLGQSLADTLFGAPSTSNPALERQRQQELERARKALEEQLARREREREELERKAREDFDRERNTAYSLLKGPKPTEIFGLKGAGDPAKLGIKDIGPAHARRDVSTQWKRLHCGAYLSTKAKAAAQAGDEEGAAYLSEQAAQAMAGGTLGVRCPEAPAPPTISTAAVPSETPQAQFYTALMHSVKGDLDQLATSNEQIQELKAKREEAARKVQEKQQEVARLQQVQPLEQEPSSESSVLAEAQRLLDEAIQDEAEATKGLEEATQRQEEIIQALKEKETLYREVEENPDQAQSLISQLQE